MAAVSVCRAAACTSCLLLLAVREACLALVPATTAQQSPVTFSLYYSVVPDSVCCVFDCALHLTCHLLCSAPSQPLMCLKLCPA